jgi:CRP-like cAMP-binding protein
MSYYYIITIAWSRRRISLPEGLGLIYKHFEQILTTKEFMYLYSLGKHKSASGKHLLHKNKNDNQLIYLINGELLVEVDSEVIAKITPNFFVGEMGYLTGRPSSADVKSNN